MTRFAKSTPTRVISVMGLLLQRLQIDYPTPILALDAVAGKWEVPSYSVRRRGLLACQDLPRNYCLSEEANSKSQSTHPWDGKGIGESVNYTCPEVDDAGNRYG